MYWWLSVDRRWWFYGPVSYQNGVFWAFCFPILGVSCRKKSITTKNCGDMCRTHFGILTAQYGLVLVKRWRCAFPKSPDLEVFGLYCKQFFLKKIYHHPKMSSESLAFIWATKSLIWTNIGGVRAERVQKRVFQCLFKIKFFHPKMAKRLLAFIWDTYDIDWSGIGECREVHISGMPCFHHFEPIT